MKRFFLSIAILVIASVAGTAVGIIVKTGNPLQPIITSQKQSVYCSFSEKAPEGAEVYFEGEDGVKKTMTESLPNVYVYYADEGETFTFSSDYSESNVLSTFNFRSEQSTVAYVANSLSDFSGSFATL